MKYLTSTTKQQPFSSSHHHIYREPVNRLKHCLFTIFIALFCMSCAGPSNVARKPSTKQFTAGQFTVATRNWTGVYASTSEIGGFAGTVFVLEKESNSEIKYRMHSYSDVFSPDRIKQDEQRGTCLADGQSLFLPEAYGYIRDGIPDLTASITRYTLVEINGRQVLMRDDALQAFHDENKLYDYGILVKVRDDAEITLNLKTVEHPSIKVLYSNSASRWNDPFVHGPNTR